MGSVDNAGKVRHFYLDHLGSVRQISTDAGHHAAFHTYFPFGEAAPPITPDGEVMKFTGHERDFNDDSLTATMRHLDYMHARFYNPNLARFSSTDPARSGKPVAPQTWNMYSYARNRPLLFIDPNGETEIRIVVSREAEVEVTFLDNETKGRGIPGRLTVTGAEMTLEGFTLEPPDNGNQRGGAIPAGTYDAEVNFSPKFQRNLVEVLGVPGRSRILLHPGNQPDQTAGCILVGNSRDEESNRLTNSRAAERALMNLIKSIKERDDENNEITKVVVEVRSAQ